VHGCARWCAPGITGRHGSNNHCSAHLPGYDTPKYSFPELQQWF
jgi:hypothetical protein